MSTIKRTLLITALATVLGNAYAAPAYLPPEALVERALSAHPALIAAQAESRASGHEAEALRRGPYEFEASVTPQQRRSDAEGRFTELEAQLGRSLRLPGKARLDTQIATQMQDVAARTLRGAQAQVAQSLLEHWLQWLGAEQALQVVASQQELLGRERDSAALMHEKGALATLDLELIDADLASAQARMIALQAAAQRARRYLQVHFPQLPLPERAPSIDEPPAPSTDEGVLLAAWLEANPELAVAKAAAVQQRLQADRARAERRADPSIGLRWLREGRDRENALGVVISVPIGGSYRRALAEQAAAQEAAADARARQAEQNADGDAADAIDRARGLHAQWQAEHQALAVHRSATARSKRAWELGELDTSAYLLAERALLDRQLAEEQVRTEATAAALSLQLQAGRLWQIGNTP